MYIFHSNNYFKIIFIHNCEEMLKSKETAHLPNNLSIITPWKRYFLYLIFFSGFGKCVQVEHQRRHANTRVNEVYLETYTF